MKSFNNIMVILILVILQPLLAVEVTIDSTQTHQEIEGLGAAFATHMLEVHNDQALIEQLITDLGLSMVRFYPDGVFEKANDNDDPYDLDWSAMDFVGTTEDFDVLSHQIGIMQKFPAEAMPRVILSVFSPPAWMKDNNSVIGGKLLPEMYEEFAEFYSAYIQGIKDSTGIDVYAISPENEPRWEQWYDSCVYTPEEMREIIKVLGERMQRDEHDVKIFGPEDLMGEDWIPWTQPWVDYYNAIVADSTALAYLDAFAIHTYEDGVEPSSPSVGVWQDLYQAAHAVNKPVWMSETSGFSAEWLGDHGAFAVAKAIFSALYYGNCSAWVWLNPVMEWSFAPETGLIIYEQSGQVNITQKYYALKQFTRFVRPGMVRLETVTDDNDVPVLAFKDPQDHTLVLVIINSTNNEQTVTFNGLELPDMNVFRTSDTDKCSKVGTISGPYTAPPNSVTTLTSNLQTTVQETGHAPQAFMLAQNYPNPFNPVTTLQYTLATTGHVSIHIYNVLGKQVRTLVSEKQTAGQYAVTWDGTGDNGTPLSTGCYFCELHAGNASKTIKMLYMK